MPLEAKVIRVIGLVQGVGFRPFVYRIAKDNGLKGYVRNLGGAEVEIHVEGEERAIMRFLDQLVNEKPPPARIEKIDVEAVRPRGYRDFIISKSDEASVRLSMIPLDLGICDECLREILDPGSRWYLYPFNSCAWCGPRFTMLERLPYDRENTAMRDFPLCLECTREYEDPLNVRRFHAEGISCPRCGPKVYLVDGDGGVLNVKDPIKEAVTLLEAGNIVAIKGIGGFHLATIATDDDVVLKLRKRKRRPQKPFALMALSMEVVRRLIYVDKLIEGLLTSPERPIVVSKAKEDNEVSKWVAPGLDSLGVMLPYTGLHYLILMNSDDKFLIMTSGNPSGEPICKGNEEAIKKLRGVADYFLLHNRRIVNRADDSVIRITAGNAFFLRRSRGFAPGWISLPFRLRKPIIAFGGLLSNVAALGIKEYAIPTQFLGDMDDWDSLRYLEEALGFLLRAYDVSPREAIIVADLNPTYTTRRLAEEWSKAYGGKLLLVQHHHAHIASVMAERGLGLEEEVVGIAIDGAGYGPDGSVWGGEILIASYSGYERVGHLRVQVMPGGDLATLYPARMLIGVLSSIFDRNELEELILRKFTHLIRGLPYRERELHVILSQAYGGRMPKTSSLGRFLDAVSALLGICLRRTYEGEPAIKLEAYASKGEEVELATPIRSDGKGMMVLDTSEVMRDVMNMLEECDGPTIARSVQYSLGRGLGLIALRAMRRRHKYIVVSGGAAVNNYILKGIMSVVGDKATLLLPRKMPPGDGGLCLGQIVIAYNRMMGE